MDRLWKAGGYTTVSTEEAGLTRPTSVLCVVTWNIQFGAQVAAAAEALQHSDELSSADIVLLQEMDDVGNRGHCAFRWA